MRDRRAIRVFRPDPVPDKFLDMILEAGRWTPSGGNSQPWELLVIKSEEKRARLSEILQEMGRWEHEWEKENDPTRRFPINSLVYTKTVPVFIVVILDPRLKKVTFQVGDGSEDRIYRQSAGHLVQNIWLMVQALGLSMVDITVRHVEGMVKDAFGIPEDFEVSDILPIGYSNQTRSKDRRTLQEFVHFDCFDKGKLRTSEQINSMAKDSSVLASNCFGKIVV
ncbi:MAG: nitroreductase family protein [Rhabdochlamydiaceae bacterium]